MSDEKNNSNGKPEDLLPEWMIRVFKPGNQLCPKCRKDLTIDDLCGVELLCTRYGSGSNRGPMAALDTICDHCGDTIRVMLGVDLRDLLQGVEGFYEYVAQHRMDHDTPTPTLPSPNTDPEIPLCDVDEGDDGKSDAYPRWVKTDRFGAIFDNGGQKENSIEREFRWNQNRRKRDRKRLITDKEFEAFRRRMARCSSKRSTKSFREFFAKLGIDIDKNYDAEGGDQ